MMFSKFFKVIIVVWLANNQGFSACTHQKKESVLDLGVLSSSYITKNSNNSPIKLNYYDVEPYLNKKGLVWDSFILPTLDNDIITQSELLMGYRNEQDSFIFPPQNGSCVLLEKPSKYENSKKTLISFSSANEYPSDDAGNLFFLLNSRSLLPSVIVKLNNQGVANCYLPNNSYHLSYGFGDLRKELVINTNTEDKNNLIKINFEKSGILKINPFLINNIKNGDLIRVGRKINAKNILFGTQNNIIPMEIENDLFKPSNFQSQTMGVDEIFQTSFLVGKLPYRIQLDIGSYVVALVRKNVLICLKEFDIHANEIIILQCPSNNATDLEEKLFNKNTFNIKFDATFYPEHLNQDESFLQWFLSNKNYYQPIIIDESKINAQQITRKSFSFLFKDIRKPEVKQYPANFDLKINDQSGLIPIFGTGLESIVRGSIPFSNFTIFQFLYPIKPEDLLSSPYARVTNGTDIQLFEPFFSKDGVLTSMSEQRFRFRVTVPSWNSTNIVEMDIDGKLHRRWVLNRGDLSLPFSITLDEKTYQQKNFTVRFSARGEETLPDFIFGLDGQMPYARTRDYLVTITGK